MNISTPTRIQLKRTKGWRLPPNTVKVDRTTPYGNPFRLGREYERETAISAFRKYLAKRLAANPELLAPLKGKDLACWCRLDELCHADILLERANLPKRRR
jgi:hypothetical protein